MNGLVEGHRTHYCELFGVTVIQSMLSWLDNTEVQFCASKCLALLASKHEANQTFLVSGGCATALYMALHSCCRDLKNPVTVASILVACSTLCDNHPNNRIAFGAQTSLLKLTIGLVVKDCEMVSAVIL